MDKYNLIFKIALLISFNIYFISYLAYISYKKTLNTIKIYNYEKYLNLLNYFLLESYEIIYRDQIVRYFISGEKINKLQLENIIRLYIHDVLNLMGKKLEKEYIEFFGSYESLISYITGFIQKKIDTDELKKVISNNEEMFS